MFVIRDVLDGIIVKGHTVIFMKLDALLNGAKTHIRTDIN
ncbi:hypothetical protein COTS27_00031 [Spirochaetota bacterium]|nr:hypothetical protein COTS27_00031 [Spirochaetota bacterium]